MIVIVCGVIVIVLLFGCLFLYCVCYMLLVVLLAIIGCFGCFEGPGLQPNF